MTERMTDKAWKALPAEHAATCQNCDWRGHYEDLNPAENLWARAEEGDTVWAGDCPDCGAMCFTRAEMERQNNAIREQDAARAMLAALGNLMAAMETPRSRKAANAWDAARIALTQARAAFITPA